MTNLGPACILEPDSSEPQMTVEEGRRIDAAEYRELLVSRRSLVRVLSSVADVVGLRDTLTGETYLVDVEHLFTGRA